MKKIRYIFLCMIAVLAIASCQKEPLETMMPNDVPEGYVKVILDMDSDFGTQEITTRSDERTGDPMIATTREMGISNAFVCVFAHTADPANDLLLQYEPVIKDNDAAGNPHYYAVLEAVDTPVMIHGLSNIDNNTVGTITAKENDKYKLTREQFYDLQILYSADNDSPLLKNQEGALLPKFTDPISLDKLTTETIKTEKARTRFSYSRVDVVMPTVADSEFPKILGLSATNVPVLPPRENIPAAVKSHEVTPISNQPAYGEDEEWRMWPAGITSENNDTKYVQGLYMYYNNRVGSPKIDKEDAIELIIRAQRDENSPAEGSYYKILLRYKAEGETEYSYDTYTANRYLVNVHALNSAGYATWEEANDAPPSNVLYDINIDGTSTSYITNGQYYIGVGAKEYYAATNYSYQSNMMYANPEIINETNLENLVYNPDGSYEFDFDFAYYPGEGSGISNSSLRKSLYIPEGFEVVTKSNYNTLDDWHSDFGNKKLRIKTKSKDAGGEIVIKVGELTQTTKIAIGEGVVTDYTNYNFVNDLTGLPDGYGNKAEDNLLLSNCYILKAHPTQKAVFFIPVVDRVNDFWENYSGLNQANTIPVENWTYNSNCDIQAIWHDGTSIEGLSLVRGYSPSGQNAIRIELPNNFENQNILIALRKGDVTIWSWHLWVTDYNPYLVTLRESESTALNHPKRNSTNQNLAMAGVDNALHSYSGALWEDGGIYAQKFIMDRNIGAYSDNFVGHGSVKDDETPVNISKGALLFQFGRKDPLPRWANYTNGYSYEKEERTPVGFVDIVTKPNKMFYGGTGQWCNEAGVANNQSILWFDKNVAISNYNIGKSIFDPSPLGFRVPINGTWNAFTTSNFYWTDESTSSDRQYGRTYNGLAYYPAGGNRFSNTGAPTAGGTSGLHRSANPSNSTQTYMLDFGVSYIATNRSYSYVGAFSVRSIQE